MGAIAAPQSLPPPPLEAMWRTACSKVKTSTRDDYAPGFLGTWKNRPRLTHCAASTAKDWHEHDCYDGRHIGDRQGCGRTNSETARGAVANRRAGRAA